MKIELKNGFVPQYFYVNITLLKKEITLSDQIFSSCNQWLIFKSPLADNSLYDPQQTARSKTSENWPIIASQPRQKKESKATKTVKPFSFFLL